MSWKWSPTPTIDRLPHSAKYSRRGFLSPKEQPEHASPWRSPAAQPCGASPSWPTVARTAPKPNPTCDVEWYHRHASIQEQTVAKNLVYQGSSRSGSRVLHVRHLVWEQSRIPGASSKMGVLLGAPPTRLRSDYIQARVEGALGFLLRVCLRAQAAGRCRPVSLHYWPRGERI